METTAYWKKIWITVTGQSKVVDAEDITKVLKLVEEELCAGVLQFRAFTHKSFEEWKTVVKLEGSENNLNRFIHRLSIFLDLDAITTWKVFCNFLMFEYCGKIEDISKVAEYELFSNTLFHQVWLFYTSERMFMIKTMKYILENSVNKNHRFYEPYSSYILRQTVPRVRTSLMKQLNYLMNEIHEDNLEHCYVFKDWVVRNNHEQLEILQSVALTVDYLPLSIEDIVELFKMFKEHNFGSDAKCLQVLRASNADDVVNIRFTEIAIFLMGLMPCWNDNEYWLAYSEEIESILLNLSHQGELYILVLSWATLQTTLPAITSTERFESYYCQFTQVAIKHSVFKSLYNIASHHLFKDSNVGKLIKKAIYMLLECVCDKFDEDGKVFGNQCAAELLAEIIKIPELAEQFVSNIDAGISSIFKTATEMFPYTFEAYTMIINEVLKHAHILKVMDVNLLQFQCFTEEYFDMYFDHKVTLMTEYRPYETDILVIPAKSQAKVFRRYGKIFVSYDCSYNYFSILTECVNRNVSKRESLKEINKIYLGFTLLNTILANPSQSLAPMTQCIQLVSSVHAKFTKPPSMNYKLIRICLDLFVTLMENDSKVIDNLTINNFLPDVIKDPRNVNNYFDKNFFVPGILLTNIRDETLSSSQDLLFSYINFLKYIIQRKYLQLRIQAPGFVFLYIHVFPIHLDWKYPNSDIKDELTYDCLHLLFDVLKQDRDKFDNDAEKVIYDFCYRVITTYEPFLEAFIRLFRRSNSYLHAYLEHKSNWSNLQKCGIVKTIKMCLNLVIRLFNLHNNNIKSLSNSKFLTLFFETDTKPSIVKIITGLVNHAFDIGIRKLSCQLLKKVAVMSHLPLLSLLELDHYQIQTMFLEKLRDPLEDEVMKVSILEFITVCINSQSGMTAAFFNLANLPKTDNLNVVEGINQFMLQYLENTKKSAEYVNSPIQSAILNLFHTLWMYRKDILISDLTRNESFWETLADPLFQPLKYSNRTYAQIYNIIMFELFKCKGDNENISNVLTTLFITRVGLVKVWIEHIMFSLDEPSNVSHGYYLLSSWKNLIIAVAKYRPECLEDRTIRKLLTQSCLDGLIQQFSYPDDVRIITLWSEMYLFLITQWPTNYYTNYEHLFSTHTRIFKYLGDYYHHVGNSCKQALLSVAITTIKDLKQFVHSNALLVDEYLHGIGKIFEKEHMEICSNQEDGKVDKKTYTNWLLLLVFGNNLLQLGFIGSNPKWFQLTQFLNKVATSIGPFIKNPTCFPIAKIAVQCLINYARSQLVKDFLYVDMKSFYDETRPPNRFIETEGLSFENAAPWYFEEWWLTYTGILQLNTILIKKFGRIKLDMYFAFIYIHGDLMINSLKLPKVTAQKSALQLVSACLHFCHALLKWQKEWRLSHTYLFIVYMQTINQIINAITGILIRPKMLKVFAIDKQSKLTLVENVSLSFMVDIMNHLMEILGLCNLCLMKSMPGILKLLSTRQTGFSDDVCIEYDFCVPKVYEDYPHLVNYGSFLCVLHFLCKTLSQISAHKSDTKEELNVSFPQNSLVAFVCPNYVGHYTISELYNSVQTFAATEISGLSASWLTKLNFEKVNFALETLNTFLATQIYLSLYVRDVRFSVLQHIKRELCSELLFFHEFIRKHMVEKHQYRVVENMVFRKVHLDEIPYSVSTDETTVKFMYARKSVTDTPHKSMKIDSTESAHGDINLQSKIFYLPNKFDVIDTYEHVDDDSDKVVKKSGTYMNRQPKTMYVGRYKDEGGKSVKIPMEKVILKYPTIPEIVEGDYLLFLSHWYIFMCELTH